MFRRVLLVGLVAGLNAGCLELDVTIHLSADGTGRIVERLLFDTMALEPLFGVIEKPDAPKERPWDFDLEDLRERASERGEGVKLVSAEVARAKGRAGWTATYRFDDITTVRLDADPSVAMDRRQSPAGKKPSMRFGFEKGRPSVLTISIPKDPEDSAATKANPAPDAVQLAQMKAMLRNLHVRVGIEVAGKITKTNARFVKGARVTLMDLEFAKVLADETNIPKLVASESLDALAGIKGVQIEQQPRVTVSFQ